MAKMRYNRNGGQRVINTINERSSSTIRKMILDGTAKGTELATILSAMNAKDFKIASDLLYADDEVFKVIKSSSYVEEQEQEEQKPRVFNKTKRMRQEAQQQKDLQHQELQEKINMLKEKRAA